MHAASVHEGEAFKQKVDPFREPNTRLENIIALDLF